LGADPGLGASQQTQASLSASLGTMQVLREGKNRSLANI
jgi:hypothetical protein